MRKFRIWLFTSAVVASMLATVVCIHVSLEGRRQPAVRPALTVRDSVRIEVKPSVKSHMVPCSGISQEGGGDAICCVCGMDERSASRYDFRNDALRSIARRRDLPVDDIAALMEYVAATDCVMRIEREAALKNDVLNLLRNQKRLPEGLADLLLDMVASKQYAPVIIDYCIQHLGAMVGSVSDDQTKARIRETFIVAAKDIGETYSGTALYSLAEMPNMSKSESDELRRLAVAACGESANTIARISAIQIAGERGYCETLPMLRGILAGTRRDAVLDMTVVGSIGLMGDATDIQLLESFRSRGGRRQKQAIDAAVQRINERHSAKQTKR